MKRAKRKKFSVFIGILKNRHSEYVEIFSRNLPQANFMIEIMYPGQVDFVFKSSRLSGANLKKIERLDYRDNEKFSFFFSKGNQNKD